MPTPFSIRQALQGSLRDYFENSGFTCLKTEALVRDLVSLLATYREEDTPLFPDVFVVTNRSALSTLSPGIEHLVLGEVDLTNDPAAKILKNAATIASQGWAIFAYRTENNTFEYGLFRSRRHSFSVSASELMEGQLDDPALQIRNCGHLAVELVNAKGEKWLVSLTTAQTYSTELIAGTEKLASSISQQIENASVGRFQRYLSELLSRILLRCHGTLLAVVQDTEQGADSLSDGVHLRTPINLFDRFRCAVAEGTADSLSDLQAAEALIDGMILSDGIVVFNTLGAVVAFRVFLNPEATERSAIPPKGGGRRRTFELMKLRVQARSLEAAFFRSQDGTTEFVEVESNE